MIPRASVLHLPLRRRAAIHRSRLPRRGSRAAQAVIVAAFSLSLCLQAGLARPPTYLNSTTSADCVVTFNEVMYHPAGEGARFEWIELHNQMSVDVDLSGWTLDGGIAYRFPQDAVIRGGSVVVIAADPAAVEAAAGLGSVLGPFNGALANEGERLVLRNLNARVMDELAYSDRPPWPVGADGSGASLAKRRPASPSSPPENWQASRQVGGTPGDTNFPDLTPEQQPRVDTLIGPTALGRWLVPDAPGADARWTLAGYDDAAWFAGTNGFGFDRSNTVPMTRPVRFYPFEGDLQDVGSNPLDGQAQSNPEFVPDRPPLAAESNASLRLDGLDDSVTMPEPVVPSAYTLSLWVKIATIRSCSLLVLTSEAGPTTHWSHQLRLNSSGRFEHYTYDGGWNLVTSGTVAQPGRWYHVAATAENGGSIRLFVNGIEEGTPDGIGSLWAAGNRWMLGCDSGHTPHHLDGWLDEVAIWHTAIDASQIAAVAAGASPMNAGGLDGLFATDLEDSMWHRNSSVRLRLPFAKAAGVLHDQLLLRLRYNDGFVAWLNGVEVARRNAPQTIEWNSAATAERTPGQSAVPETVDLSSHLDLLRPGFNMLAIQGLNDAVDDDTFLVHAELAARRGAALTDAPGLVFSELPGAAGTPFWCELRNGGSAPVALAGYCLRDARGEVISLANRVLEPGEFEVVALPPTAPTGRAGDRLFLFSADGSQFVDAARVAPEPQARARPDAGGPFLTPSALTPGGANVFALHDEIVINEICYHAPPTYRQPGILYAENDEQWIELLNRSDHAVNLAGWRLTDAVDFNFGADCVLGPGELLVVARNAAALRERHPGLRVLGDFSRHLSHRSDRVAVQDDAGNPVDEVRYGDDAPWPPEADGGGSSLELVDARADNASPSAWAASDTASRASWRRYAFTARAVEPVFGPPLNGFSELRLGLLDDGECLLDNISVIEDPRGISRSLLQNGGFAGGAATWRLLGNHSHSRADADTEHPGNLVLDLVATDARGYLHNQIETTLMSGGAVVPVVAGREYAIAFDAKWLRGSPQLHVELYYNRVARTIILAQPIEWGTPGQPNSTVSANLGPTYSSLTHDPPVPHTGETIGIRVTAQDPDRVDSLTLHYAINEGVWLEVPMDRASGEPAAGPDTPVVFTVSLPAQAVSGTVIQFYVVGRDGRGAVSYGPASGPDSRALIRVDNRSSGPKRRSFHLILAARDGRRLDDFANMMSDDRLGATVVWDGREVFYDCGVHLHGSMFSRNNPDTAAYNVRFPADRPFRGVHRTVQIKRRVIQEIIAKHVQNQSGLPGMYDDIVHLFSHRPGNAGPARLSLAHYNDIYLDSQYENGAVGTLFNMEGIRVALATDDGSPEGVKLPFPIEWMANYDIADLGEDPEQYRWSTMIRNNRARDDYAPYIALAKAFSLTGVALERAVPDVMDVDEWMRVFALLSLFGIGDTYTQGNPHNLNFYVRPTDRRVLALPYDWDFFFALDVSAPLWGDQNLSKIISRPVHTRCFYGHLLDLMETTFQADLLAPWVAHYGAVADEDYRSVLDRVRARSQSVRGRLPAVVPFAITTNSGADFTVTNLSVQLEGRAWIDVREIRLAGQSTPPDVSWRDAVRWQVTVPLATGTNPLALEALNRRGDIVGQDAITVTTTAADDLQRASLRITEIMYHPPPPTPIEIQAGFRDADQFEFLELANLGPGEVPLEGVRLDGGVWFDFTVAVIRTLPPGGRAVVTRDAEAARHRYGENLPMAGNYAGALDNGGETLRLLDRHGFVIQEFAYDDDGDWPIEADGSGRSIENTEPLGNAAEPGNWQASPRDGGSPGQPEFVQPVFVSVTIRGDQLAVRFAARAGQPYRLLACADTLRGPWEPAAAIPPGPTTQTIEVNAPLPPGTRLGFYRLVSP